MITFVLYQYKVGFERFQILLYSEQLYMTCIIEIWIFRSIFCWHEILNLENL